jgi:hypothetical protein
MDCAKLPVSGIANSLLSLLKPIKTHVFIE